MTRRWIPRALAALCAFGALALGLALTGGPAAAQSNPAAVPGRPVAPAVGFAVNNNSHLLVWAEDRGTGTGLDLYSLRLSSSGLPSGRVVPLLVAPGNQSDPSLVFSTRLNEFFLVYTDDGTGGGGPGATPTSNVPIPPIPGTPGPTPTAGPTQPPLPPIPFARDRGETRVLPLDPAAALVLGADAQGQDAEARWLDADVEADLDAAFDNAAFLAGVSRAEARGLQAGVVALAGDDGALTPLSGLEGLAALQPPPVPTPGPSPTAGPTITPGGPTATPGGPVTPGPPAAGSRNLRGTFVSTYGHRLTNTFGIIESPADDTFPDISLLEFASTDQYALVWREVNGVDAQLSVVRLRGQGHWFVVDYKNTVVTGSDISRPSVAADPVEGAYLVSWAETPQGEAARDVYGRRLNRNAAPYRPTFGLASGPEDQVYPSLASLGSFGGYLLAWEQRDGVNPPDIQTRQLNRNGYPYRSQYALAGGPEYTFSPNVSSTDFVTTLTIWLERNAAGDHSILTQEVNRSGRPNGPLRVAVVGGASTAPLTPVPPVNTPPVPPIPPVP